MSKFILSIALMLAMAAGAQASDIVLTADGAYEKKDVVTVDSVSAAVLFDRAMMALSDWTGPDGKAKAGIDYQNQETHTVIYKGSFYAGSRKWKMTRIERYANFTLKVRCKDGRAQVTANVGSLTATVELNGRSRTMSLGEAIRELEKTSGDRRERGEESVDYIVSTIDGIFNAMVLYLRGQGSSLSDDDF